MKKEETPRFDSKLEDAELIDLGPSSELTEGGIGKPGEVNNSSNLASGF